MNRFNIRVYGLLINEQKQEILVSDELVFGNKILKFPGGGLEFGEGIIDCLKREWMEELGLKIEIKAHFYTTDFYQKSSWDDSQIISIYYLVSVDDQTVFPINNGVEYIYFLPIAQLEQHITLPIDLVVASQLKQQFIH